mgnify:CR=1 FL=1
MPILLQLPVIRQEIVLGWARHTPSDFILSAKLPQTITHKKALDVARGIELDLNQFLEMMKPLIDARKLACVLVQLPPFLRFGVERLESFLSTLPDNSRFAVEFRHDSWLNDETLKMLEKASERFPGLDIYGTFCILPRR